MSFFLDLCHSTFNKAFNINHKCSNRHTRNYVIFFFNFKCLFCCLHCSPKYHVSKFEKELSRMKMKKIQSMEGRSRNEEEEEEGKSVY